jgi:hypothetical protein
MARKKPLKISLRVYPVGFGDCFLLGFHYTGGDDRFVLVDFGSTELTRKRKPRTTAFREYMMKVAADIAARCGRVDGKGGRLHAIVATHRHADHINGFETKSKEGDPDRSGDVIASLAPKFVVQPWTEDPDLAPDALGPAEAATADGPRGFAAMLAGMQGAAAGVVEEASRLSAGRIAAFGAEGDTADVSPEAAQRRRTARVAFVGQLRFLGEDNITNLSAVQNLIAMGKASKPGKGLYLHANSPLDLELPGVAAHVLGPPTIAQSQEIRAQRTADPVEFWMLLGATGARFSAQGGTPFPGRGCVGGDRAPDSARWFRDRVRSVRAETLLGIVRSLDEQMNNTSLILVFQTGDARLLFPGDAQIENWNYALSSERNRALVAGTTFYKVGHHGSRNATPKEALWAHFGRRSAKTDDPDRLWSVVSTLAGKHGSTEATKVPRTTLVQALEDETNFRTTQKFTRTEPDFRDFDVDPKTGRVTEA